jgi:hypothetical protein
MSRGELWSQLIGERVDQGHPESSYQVEATRPSPVL